MFRTETEGRMLAYVAIFPDLALSFDLVERLIGAAAELSDVQVSIDDRPVEGLTKFLRLPLPVHLYALPARRPGDRCPTPPSSIDGDCETS